MRGCLSTEDTAEEAVVTRARNAPQMVGLDLASSVTCKEPYVWRDAQAEAYGSPTLLHGADLSVTSRMLHVVAYDFGLKRDRKSTRLNSSHVSISYAVFCLKKKKT